MKVGSARSSEGRATRLAVLAAGGAVLCLLSAGTSASATTPSFRVPDEQLLLVREAMQVVRTVGDDFWEGWNRAPKTTLIIGTEHEYLLNLPPATQPPAEFAPLQQSFMGQQIYHRGRTLPSTLRTAFPIGAIPAAVVGAWRPEVESPNEWVVTLVEQWFQVLQMTRGEQDKATDLEIAATGLPAWQIDYPFPFDDPDVGNAMLLLGTSLYDFWSGGGRLPRSAQRTFQAETAWAALQNLHTIVTLKYGDRAYKYFQLQVWRDGVARYSGLLVAREIARAELRDKYHYVIGFDKLPERQTYAEMWEENLSTRFLLIRTSGLPGARDHTSFPALGHGLAELLDVVNPEWKQRYFDRGVWLDDLVAETLASASEPISGR